jgi:hypothetical protein
MAFNPKDERINELERNLYSRDAELIKTSKRPELGTVAEQNKHAQYGWKDETPIAEELSQIQETEDRKSSFVTKVFMASVLFFVIAAAIAGYVILGGFNVISPKNVDIAVRGLTSVSAGEEISIDLIVQNKNSTAIEKGTLFVEYPEGTRKADNVTETLPREQIDFEDISAGASLTKTVQAVLFGQKDTVQQIKIRVEYVARGSNAVFTKEKAFDVTIKSSPVVMTATVPNEINTGQEVAMTVELASNANALIDNMLVRAEYPFGFTFLSANPAPAFDNNVWNIGDLDPKEKRTITIRGRMVGQNDEERTFRFTTGTASETDEKLIAVNYITLQESVFIRKSFIGLDLRLNSRADNAIVSAGDRVQGSLTWTNNLPVSITDAAIQIKLSGSGLDTRGIEVFNNGFYRSSDNTITWDRNSLPSLRSVEPGETGTVTFSVGSLQGTSDVISRNRNLEVLADVLVRGTRIQDGASQTVESQASNVAKVSTNLAVAAKAVYSIGTYDNRGPMPPRANQETTYTVVLNVSNTFNDVSNISVKTSLPPYVRWLNNATDVVQYDESSRTVTWNIPSLRSGVGYNSPSRELSFQIGLTPSSNQAGTSPDLTGQIDIFGTDRFTGTVVTSSKPPLNTNIASDPDFRNGDERVIQ